MKHIAIIAENVRQFWYYIQENHPDAKCSVGHEVAKTETEVYHFIDYPDKAYGYKFSEIITVGTGYRLVNYNDIIFIARRYLGDEWSSFKKNP